MDENEYSHHKNNLSLFWMWTSTHITNISCFFCMWTSPTCDIPDRPHGQCAPLASSVIRSRFCFCPYLFTWIISLFVVIPPFALPFSKFSVKMRAVLMHRRVAQIDEFKSGMESSRSDVVTVTPLQDFSRWNFLGWIIFILRWLFVPSVDLMSRSYPICGFIKFGRF